MPETDDTSNNQSSESTIIPISSPYYLGSSDNPNSILVSNVFNGSGFTAWKRSITIALSAKNKLSFVDGTISSPSVGSSTYSQWYRVNSMVISWLLNSLHKNIADSVLFLQTASAIWTELNQRFEQSSGASIFQIQQQLHSITQGSDDFQTYYTKLMKIWDELRLLQDIPDCSCGSATKIVKFLDDQRLIQLLMGLNDSYKIIRGQLLMMKPLPSLSTAYSLITQEEHQRTITTTSSFSPDAIAMHASVESNNFSKKSLICNHCKKPGHTKSQCYRLNGFPSTFKFTKTKKEEPKSSVQNITSTSPQFTPDQYQQLFQMFTSHMSNSSSSIPSNSQANSSITDGAMNNEGPFIKE